jgi:hypothetical protein
MAGPQFLGNPPGMQPYLLYFYDGSATDGQYYPPESILGFEKVGANQLRIYMKGAKDVDAKDAILITIGTSITYKQAAEYILNGVAYQSVHKSDTKIISVVGATAAESLRPEFASCTITYGTCCGGGGTMSNWILSDGSTTQQIDNGETVTTADSTYINHVVSATNTLTTSLSAVDGTSVVGTRFLSKDNTWDVVTPTKYYAKTTTTFEFDSGTAGSWALSFGSGKDTAVSFTSNQLTDDQVRDSVLYDPLGKIEIYRIYGFLESASASGSIQVREGTFSIGTSYTGTQTFTMATALGTINLASANTYYPFSFTSGFVAPAAGLMRTLQLVDRAGSTRVYKGQVTYEYAIVE